MLLRLKAFSLFYIICHECKDIFMIYLKLIQFYQNSFPNPKGSNFDEIFKTFFHPLGLGKEKCFENFIILSIF